MKNFEKYKTAEERTKGFNIFCDKSEECADCELRYELNGGNDCKFSWLDLEYEEEPK